MAQNISDQQFDQLQSYQALRKIIGIIGVLLPFILAAGTSVLSECGVWPSLSSYYYSILGDVFVGALFMIGIFLMFYKGYDDHDSNICSLAGACAIGVALFPTKVDCLIPIEVFRKINLISPEHVGQIHLVIAASFFLLIAYISMMLFTKTADKSKMTREKIKRNKVYRACGIIILLSIALIAFAKISGYQEAYFILGMRPVFLLETIAIIAFGVAWLVKGEAIFNDRP